MKTSTWRSGFWPLTPPGPVPASLPAQKQPTNDFVKPAGWDSAGREKNRRGTSNSLSTASTRCRCSNCSVATRASSSAFSRRTRCSSARSCSPAAPRSSAGRRKSVFFCPPLSFFLFSCTGTCQCATQTGGKTHHHLHAALRRQRRGCASWNRLRPNPSPCWAHRPPGRRQRRTCRPGPRPCPVRWCQQEEKKKTTPKKKHSGGSAHNKDKSWRQASDPKRKDRIKVQGQKRRKRDPQRGHKKGRSTDRSVMCTKTETGTKDSHRTQRQRQ